jgi:hypothetical protein
MQTNNNINLNKIVLISPSELSKKVSINIANQTPKVQFKSDQLLINNNKGIPALTGLNFRSNSSIETLNLPSRKINAVTGSKFLELTSNMSRTERENAILNEVLSGNVPDFVRNMKNVSISYTDKNGKNYNATIKVLPDYLAIGSNKDFVRIPMNPITAQKIANRTGTSLPTKKVVDQIYLQSEKLIPSPMQAGSNMMSNQYYQTHNNKVEQQRKDKGIKLGSLVSGHKKDVVISNRLDEKPNRVAIYGWHKNDGKPIQSLSTVHEDTYADYSHGIRLISNKVNINGRDFDLKDVLKNPELSKILSDEGIIKNTVIKF